MEPKTEHQMTVYIWERIALILVPGFMFYIWAVSHDWRAVVALLLGLAFLVGFCAACEWTRRVYLLRLIHRSMRRTRERLAK